MLSNVLIYNCQEENNSNKKKRMVIKMMKESTKMGLEKMAQRFKGMAKTSADWSSICRANIDFPSYSTFKKYIPLKKIVEKNPVSIEFIVEELNACAGDDCTECQWEYEVIDGKVYEIIHKYLWE